jgi:hypothetical protein
MIAAVRVHEEEKELTERAQGKVNVLVSAGGLAFPRRQAFLMWSPAARGRHKAISRVHALADLLFLFSTHIHNKKRTA